MVGDAAFLHRDVEAARVGAIERADGGDGVLGRKGLLRISWGLVQSNSVERPQLVLILGGGFGGLEAGKVLRGKPLRVTLLDRHNYHLFQPLLYQVATATLSPGDIASPLRWIFRRSANVRVLLGEAVSIDAASRWSC